MNVPYEIAIRAISRFLKRRPKSKKSVRVATVKDHDPSNKSSSDALDYDGIGNYDRFPCINK